MAFLALLIHIKGRDGVLNNCWKEGERELGKEGRKKERRKGRRDKGEERKGERRGKERRKERENEKFITSVLLGNSFLCSSCIDL